jgi:hypothetical protein
MPDRERGRRIVVGKPLLVVAAASIVVGCSTSPGPVQMDASHVSGNLDTGADTGPRPDAGQPDASFVSGNLDVGCFTCDADLLRDANVTPDGGIDDADVDGGHDGGP